jgi:signal transduction histidine kinase
MSILHAINKIFIRLNARNERKLESRGILEKDGMLYTREKLFLVSIQFMTVIGFMAYIPSAVIAIIEKRWMLISVDSGALAILIVFVFANILPAKIRKILLLIALYLLGSLLIIALGPLSTGLIWLIAFSVICTIYFDFKRAIISLLLNFLALLMLGIFIRYKTFDTLLINEYTIGRWLVVSINFMMINLLIVFSLAYFIYDLEKSLKREKELQVKLKKKSERLIDAKVKAEESDQLKSAFLANVSHEFRTPMNAIIGFTEIMLYTNPDEEKRKRYLERIQSSSEQLLQIIHNTIEYSKIEMGTINLHNVKFQVNEILYTLLEQLKPLCPQGITYVLEGVHPDKKNYIVADRERLMQILTNLITNAFKFTEKGKVTFGIMESAHKGFYQFFVRDTGIGIRKEKQKDIFTRFHKEDDFKNGTGLGLSISATLIVYMGGRIWLDSETGMGTAFYFILPINYSETS